MLLYDFKWDKNAPSSAGSYIYNRSKHDLPIRQAKEDNGITEAFVQRFVAHPDAFPAFCCGSSPQTQLKSKRQIP